MQLKPKKLNRISDLSLTTDGIFTFKPRNKKTSQRNENDILSFLLHDQNFYGKSNFLDRKIRYIEEIWNHEVTDDLAIIRLIFD